MAKRTYYTTKDLVSFGKFMVSKQREDIVMSHPTLKDPERLRDVSDADLANWKHTKDTADV